MQFRPAKPADLAKFMDPVPYTVKAVVAEHDGEVLGVGGVYYQGMAVIAFSEFDPKMRRFATDMLRGARKIVEIVKSVRAPVYAIPGPFASAPVLLKRFGFEPIEETNFYVWRGAGEWQQ